MARVRLLDRGMEEAFVYPEVKTRNSSNDIVTVPAKDPIRILMTTAGDRSSIAELPGQISETVIKCTARDAPIGPWAMVVYRGRQYDVAAPPRFSPGATSASRHVEFILKSRPSGVNR